MRVIDPEGGQVADVFAFCADDPSEYHSAEHTRVHVGRLFPHVGEQFVTNRRRPILTLEADDSPGVHDMLCAACDPTRYQGLGVEGLARLLPGEPARRDAPLGVERVEVPQPINLFMNIPVGVDGEFGLVPAPTKPGDSATLRAELDAMWWCRRARRTWCRSTRARQGRSTSRSRAPSVGRGLECSRSTFTG